MAGETLHAEIQANASASSPIAQMARESLGLEGSVDEQLEGFKRRREELVLLKLEPRGGDQGYGSGACDDTAG